MVKVKDGEKAKKSKVNKDKKATYAAVGRRKEATARVRLEAGVKKDELGIFVNGKPVEEYFGGEVFKKLYLEPFKTTNTVSRFKVTVKVVGGGLAGQLGAFVHGAARALVKVDEELRPILKKKGLLTRDQRERERRKAGLAGKARAGKQSPKR